MADAAETEARALDMGWSPKDQWRGAADKWVDAETFVKRGEEILPILQANNRKSEARLATLEGELRTTKTQLVAANEQIEVLTNMGTKANRDAAKEHRRQLIAQRTAAQKDENSELEIELTEAIEDQTAIIRAAEDGEKSGKPNGKEKPAAVAAANPMDDPTFRAWAQDNPWFGTDFRRTSVATGIAQELRATPEGRALVGRAFFDKVTEETNKFYGQHSPAKRGTSKVEGGGPSDNGGGGGGGGDEKTFANLPQEAKDICIRQATQMVGKDRKFKTIDEWKTYYVTKYFEE